MNKDNFQMYKAIKEFSLEDAKELLKEKHKDLIEEHTRIVYSGSNKDKVSFSSKENKRTNRSNQLTLIKTANYEVGESNIFESIECDVYGKSIQTVQAPSSFNKMQYNFIIKLKNRKEYLCVTFYECLYSLQNISYVYNIKSPANNIVIDSLFIEEKDIMLNSHGGYINEDLYNLSIDEKCDRLKTLINRLINLDDYQIIENGYAMKLISESCKNKKTIYESIDGIRTRIFSKSKYITTEIDIVDSYISKTIYDKDGNIINITRINTDKRTFESDQYVYEDGKLSHVENKFGDIIAKYIYDNDNIYKVYADKATGNKVYLYASINDGCFKEDKYKILVK